FGKALRGADGDGQRRLALLALEGYWSKESVADFEAFADTAVSTELAARARHDADAIKAGKPRPDKAGEPPAPAPAPATPTRVARSCARVRGSIPSSRGPRGEKETTSARPSRISSSTNSPPTSASAPRRARRSSRIGRATGSSCPTTRGRRSRRWRRAGCVSA